MNNQKAIDFLQKWKKGGPWVLTCIETDRKGITTQTFKQETIGELGQWLHQYNGKRNIYFHVNPTVRDMRKKAERGDIKELAWLHVDIDPRAGEDIEQERKRALDRLTTNLPKNVPPPSVVVFSGGGYQGFWKLKEPISVDGDLVLAEDAKRYNQQLELLFGADNCHNIDRIMRLPWTMNLPDARKMKKGRKPELAKLVEFNENEYELASFTPAPAVQLEGVGGFSDTMEIPGNIDRLQDVNELDRWSVPDRVKVVIVQGQHPDEPKEGDNSRSSWVFDVVCNLTRCEVPDDVIFSILTDPEFAISESILEKGTNAEKYAIRQITRGKEEAVDPWLRKMNETYAVIANIGGKCRIVEEVLDTVLDRTYLTKQSFSDHANFWKNQEVQVGMTQKGIPVMMKVGKWWQEHAQRRQYKNIVFAPGHEVPNSYNLWQGFGCENLPGDWSLFRHHIFENICEGDEKLFDYTIGWMARAVQKPAEVGEVAIVLRGGKGVGKSLFAKLFGEVFGRHFMQVSNAGHLVGNFNAHLQDVVVLFADEAFFAKDPRHASTLKTLITENTITIEAKGVDAQTCPNYIHLIMASNETHVIPASGDERRFFVLDVAKGHQQDHSYFSKIIKQMENGGREALLHDLLIHDLGGFNVRKVPQTNALREQKKLSLTTEEDWWYQKLLEGRLTEKHKTWELEVLKSELLDDFISNRKKFNDTRQTTASQMGRFLRSVCPCIRNIQKMAEFEVTTSDGFTTMKKQRAYFLIFPSLENCRKYWEEEHGEEEWVEILDQSEMEINREPF